MPKLPAGGSQEPPIGGDPHQHLSDTQGDDLRVGQLASAVAASERKQVIRRRCSLIPQNQRR